MRKIAEYTKSVLGETTGAFAVVPAALPGNYVVQVTHVPGIGFVELGSAALDSAAVVPGSLVGFSGSGSAAKALFAFEASGLGPVELSIAATGDTETLGDFLVEVFTA